MNLDYEPKRSRHPDGVPGWAHFVGAIACCLLGAFAGSTVALRDFWNGWVPCCGTVAGLLAMLIALPVVAFIHDVPMWLRLVLATATGFSISLLGTYFVLESVYAT